MNYISIFINSLKLPDKQAMFRLNRAGMDYVVVYMFILLGIVALPSLVRNLVTDTGIGADMNIVFKLIYFFMFYYLVLVVIVFAVLSVVAYMAKGVAYVMQRKLRFPMLWKMSAFTTTVPFLLYAVVSAVYPVADTYLLISFVYTALLLFVMIRHYPKRKRKS